MNTEITELYKNYKTLPVDLLFKFQMILFMFNYSHYEQNLPACFHNYFTLNSSIHSHNTRSSAAVHLYQKTLIMVLGLLIIFVLNSGMNFL